MNRRWLFVAAAGVALFAWPARVCAADATTDAGAQPDAAAASQQASQATSPPAARANGLAVLALSGASGPAWTLAQAVYANDALRPSAVDEAHARVLAGEAPAQGAPRELVDLAETRAAVHGDDAPSRALLASLANTLRVRGIVVVEMDREGRPTARLFLADSGAFDAAHYEPDTAPPTPAPPSPASPAWRWNGATTSLARAFAAPPASAPSAPIAPALATSDVPVAPRREEKPASTPFYTSPWFWGAVGAAAFGGAAIYFATRDNSSGTIHLQMQVPK